LLWRVLLANGIVLALSVLLLAVTPITISAPIALNQLLILLAGLVVMLVVNFVLLRPVISPLRRLTRLMETIDPGRPGRRLTGIGPGQAEVSALASAFNEMLDRLENERRESARVALAAQERERIRIARELHDEIGQTLTAVAIHAEQAAHAGQGENDNTLRRIADEVRNSLDDVRRIARELRPEALDDLGLVNALISLCSRVAGDGPIRVERRLDGGLPRLDPEVELVVYRVAQESLTNVIRHSRASDASISLVHEAGEIVLRVRDDGRGLPEELPEGTAGISGMRERALLVGGSLTIWSQPDRGTEVRLAVPARGQAS
jgi:two-component system sensor histidine kinase UhpB